MDKINTRTHPHNINHVLGHNPELGHNPDRRVVMTNYVCMRVLCGK